MVLPDRAPGAIGRPGVVPCWRRRRPCRRPRKQPNLLQSATMEWMPVRAQARRGSDRQGGRAAMITTLRDRLGEKVSTSASVLDAHGRDENYPEVCPPLAVVFAESVADVQETLA